MAQDIVATKRCGHCKQQKPTTDFYRCKAHRDGLTKVCKTCSAEATRRFRATEKGKAYHRQEARAFARTDKGRAVRRRTSTRYYAKVRKTDMVRARGAVHDAVLCGRMPRANTLPCAHCGKQAESYHHHLGYALEHRLSVIPLCAVCHKAAET